MRGFVWRALLIVRNTARKLKERFGSVLWDTRVPSLVASFIPGVCTRAPFEYASFSYKYIRDLLSLARRGAVDRLVTSRLPPCSALLVLVVS